MSHLLLQQRAQVSRSCTRRACGRRVPRAAGRAAARLQPAGRPSRAELVRLRAATEETEAEVQEVVLGKPAAVVEEDDTTWVPVCRPEDLPKGVRKEVVVDGSLLMMFWYRNQIYAIEARSPAEGAYSEGFIKAKFTQDYCIECPSTGSLFSLQDGSIVSWYPNNPVLRLLTPQNTCRPMEIYPVKLAQEAIYVDVTRGTLGGVKQRLDRGGAGTSLENNNVFTVQPAIYFEGQDPTKERASLYASPSVGGNTPSPLVVASGTVGAGLLAVAGTAVCIYYENIIGLAAFWIVFGGVVGAAGFNYVNSRVKDEAQK